MASSQVEFVSSSPFGCVLRDHNRNNNGRSTFQKNLKDLVQSCISKSNPNENSQIQMDKVDFNGTGAQRKSRVHERWAKAREIVFPQTNEDAQSVSSNASTFLSDTSVETPSFGAVSSLVQRWRDFEAEGKISFCTSRSNSVEAPGTPPVNVNDDNFGDWESDRTVHSGRDSDDAENERLRVVDIIRKLKSAECNDCGESLGNESLPRVRVGLDHNLEQRGVGGIMCSPRIRGRQAFADLLMQMERERHQELEALVERKTVSRFPQRGRIQALLRVRFLRRGQELRDGPHTNSTTGQLNRLEQGSNIMHLRERFSTGVEQGAACLRNSCREVVDNTPNMEKPCVSNRPKEVVVGNTADAKYSSTSNQLREVIHHHDGTDSRRSCSDTAVDTTPNAATSSTSNRLKECTHHEGAKTTVHTPKVQNSEGLHQDASMSDFMRQRIGSHESTDTVSSSVDGCKENRNAKEQEGTNSLTHPQSVEDEQEANNRQLIETFCDWRCDISHSQSEWGEQEQSNEQQLEETSQDWISDIARPRSDWEGLRQERYQEMLDPYLDNGDIRQLLQRKSVSSFLSSGMRERIDQLMISRTQRQPQQMGNQIEEQNDEVEEEVVEEKEQEDEHDGDSNDDDDEEESPIGRGYSDFLEYADQTTSSNHEVTDDSDQVASPSPQQSPSSNIYFHDNQQRAFSPHPSVEMELIYDLRGHMEQLHQEVSEIRKSIKSCINMQSKLQRSMKQEVAAAISHSVKREGKESISRVPRKGCCCVCCEMQVDSLLYRCGHMCTCFKCAHELQWSSGACPICRAPILDVVRTYADNR